MDGHCSGLHRILPIRNTPILLFVVHKGVETVEGKKKLHQLLVYFERKKRRSKRI